jgi:hypothetical protein
MEPCRYVDYIMKILDDFDRRHAGHLGHASCPAQRGPGVDTGRAHPQSHHSAYIEIAIVFAGFIRTPSIKFPLSLLLQLSSPSPLIMSAPSIPSHANKGLKFIGLTERGAYY